MSMQKKVLLLVGSPKGQKSTSDSLGTYLLDRLKENGLEVNKVYIHPAVRSEEGRKSLFTAIADADILVFAFPLYVDSLPAPVIKAMELLAKHRQESKQVKAQQMLAIINCGFPEVQHNDVALGICRCFAIKCGFEWAGGLALGAGGAINGKPLKEVGGMARNVIKSLDLTATALAEGKPVPQEAMELMAKSLMPTRVYLFFGERSWKSQAKKNGIPVESLYDRPYQN